MSWKQEPATEKQKSYMRKLGIAFGENVTKGEASALIEAGKPRKEMVRCWECGCETPKRDCEWDGFDWHCGC